MEAEPESSMTKREWGYNAKFSDIRNDFLEATIFGQMPVSGTTRCAPQSFSISMRRINRKWLMTKHPDSSRIIDSGVSGNAQMRAREIRGN